MKKLKSKQSINNVNIEFIWNSTIDSNLLLVKSKSRRNENSLSKLNGKEKSDK